jgi:Co/Zn/Cd efflux system component
MSRILLLVVVLIAAWFALNYLFAGDATVNAAFLVASVLGLAINIGIVIGKKNSTKPKP